MKNLKLDSRYIAGIVDGEGYLSLVRGSVTNKQGRRYTYVQPNFSIAMDLRATKMLQGIQVWAKALGSTLRLKTYSYKSNKGRVYIKLVAYNPRNILPICKALVPYLVIKKENAELIIRFCELKQSRKRTWHADSSVEIKLLERCKENNKSTNKLRGCLSSVI